MVLHGWDSKRLIFEEDAISSFPNDMTKSAEGKTSNALIEIFTHKKSSGSMEVFPPNPVAPRQIASGSSKESDASRNTVTKK